MSNEFENVIAHPHSLAAREALAEEWREANDPRAQFVSDQIDVYEGRYYPGDATRVNRAVIRAIEHHGRDWAGELADVSTDFEFELGLVYGVAISVDTFVKRGTELIQVAPIVHVRLSPPGDPTRVADVPALAQMRSLAFGGGPTINDEVVERLAASPYVAGLRGIDLARGNITHRSVPALMRLADQPGLIYIDVSGNPCASYIPSQRAQRYDEETYIVGDAGRSSLSEAYTALNQGYGPGGRPLWPPSLSKFSFDDDG